jgi:hypothetical protein
MTIEISQAVLDEARVFLEEQGSNGREGTAMLVADSYGWVRRMVIPHQIAGKPPESWVLVTDRGKLELAASLEPGEIYASRIHSHPGIEPHSQTDNTNPALTFEGALSIVVPFYGLALRRGLQGCLIYRLSRRQWRELRGEQRGRAVRGVP